MFFTSHPPPMRVKIYKHLLNSYFNATAMGERARINSPLSILKCILWTRKLLLYLPAANFLDTWREMGGKQRKTPQSPQWIDKWNSRTVLIIFSTSISYQNPYTHKLAHTHTHTYTDVLHIQINKRTPLLKFIRTLNIQPPRVNGDTRTCQSHFPDNYQRQWMK